MLQHCLKGGNAVFHQMETVGVIVHRMRQGDVQVRSDRKAELHYFEQNVPLTMIGANRRLILAKVKG
jgi:hypothetical protein